MTNIVELSFFALQVICGNPGGWTFAESAKTLEAGVEEVTVRLTSEKPQTPPQFQVVWKLPQRDETCFWRSEADTYGIRPDWCGFEQSMIASCLPVYSLFSDANENRLTVAADDAMRPVGFKAGLHEDDQSFCCIWKFFESAAKPSTNEVLRLRFDNRRVFWAEAIREASDWVSATPGYEPLDVPTAAYAPLYSAWYSFHQNLFDRDVEAECEKAAALGMKTVIVDHGWETDDASPGFDFCGDWEVSKRRFPDMAAHVKKVHALGMKYMIWYSVPYVGIHSKAATTFRGKFLREPTEGKAGVLDPRFPEVREYLAGLYEKALRDWDLDGLKLDFIDRFQAEAGVPEAVDELMTDVVRRLKAIKPEVLIEFRTNYIGPAIRKYGNMFRVGDCPGDFAQNRCSIAWLRLTSGKTAVHSDMLEWHSSATPEDAARFILNTLFGTIQYSVMLRTLPKAHLDMIRHWIGFSQRHEDALLHGAFRPYWPQHRYPLLVGESAAERIIGVYNDDLIADVGAADRSVFVLNATSHSALVLRLPAKGRAVAYDTFGHETGTQDFADGGLVEATCPRSGYLEITFAK